MDELTREQVERFDPPPLDIMQITIGQPMPDAMRPSSTGEWVKYKDYAALRKQVQAMTERAKKAEAQIPFMVKATLSRQVADLTAKLEAMTGDYNLSQIDCELWRKEAKEAIAICKGTIAPPYLIENISLKQQLAASQAEVARLQDTIDKQKPIYSVRPAFHLDPDELPQPTMTAFQQIPDGRRR